MDEFVHFAVDVDMTANDWDAFVELARVQQEEMRNG